MKAIRVHKFGGPEVMTLEELPDPHPGHNQVLIRVRAVGVNPVETYLRSGSNPALPLPAVGHWHRNDHRASVVRRAETSRPATHNPRPRIGCPILLAWGHGRI